MTPNEAVEKVSFQHLASSAELHQHSSIIVLMDEAAMARYKHIDTSPRFLATDLQLQLQGD